MTHRRMVSMLCAVALLGGMFVGRSALAQTDSTSGTPLDSVVSAPPAAGVATQPVEPGYKPRVFYGGNVYLGFGNGTTLGASPMVGLRFTPKLSAGVGVTYIYYTLDDYTSHSYGGRLTGWYSVIPAAYLKGEFAYYWYDQSNMGVDLETISVPYLFLGAGVRSPIGGNVFLEADVMFDVLRDENSRYRDWQPVFTVGVSAGI